MRIKTGTVRYNNKILVSDGNFSRGKNDEVNKTPKISHQSTITHHELEKKSNITQAQKPTITHHELAKEPTHEDGKIVLVLALAGGFAMWNVFLMKHENENHSSQFCAEPIITQNGDTC